MSIKTIDHLTIQIITPVPGCVELASRHWPAVRLGMSCLAAMVLFSGCGSDRSVSRTSDPFLEPEARVAAAAPVDEEREQGFLARLLTRQKATGAAPNELGETESAVAQASGTAPAPPRQPAEPVHRAKARAIVQHASAIQDDSQSDLPASPAARRSPATTHALHQSTHSKSAPEPGQEQARLEAERLIAELDARLAASRQARSAALTPVAATKPAQVELLPALGDQRAEAARQAGPSPVVRKPEPPRQPAPIDPALELRDRFTWKSLESEPRESGQQTNDRSTGDQWTRD